MSDKPSCSGVNDYTEKPQKIRKKRKRDKSRSKGDSNDKNSSGKKRKKNSEKSESKHSEKKITLKSLNAINSRDKKDIRNASTKTKSKSKSSQKKKKRKLNVPSPNFQRTKSSSDDDTEVEDFPLSDDLPNYVDKFGIFESKVSHVKSAAADFNILFSVIDEICLEGLDGITLEALWTRISVASEQLLPFADGVMRYFWNIITSRSDIEFFFLQEPREKLVIFDRYENHDPALGAIIDPVKAPLDIYPFSPVKDAEVLGSASSYETRINVSDQVRNRSLQEVELVYGNRLIMVGSQKLRTKVLTNPKVDPNIELTSPEYLLLERIARSRKSGELTQGKVSLQNLNKDAKTLFYNRKVLLENELITKQQFYLISPDAHHSACTLLHLDRFCNLRKTKSQIMTEQIVEVLRKRPFYRMDCADARRVFGHSKLLKKLFKFQEFQKVVKVDTCYRLRDLYPHISQQQWKNKGTDSEKFVRTIELINPSINVGGSWNEDDPKDDSSDEDTSKEMIFNRPLLYQIYMFINNSGDDGISLKEIRNSTGFDYYSVRSAIKSLLSANYICGLKIDFGRQRLIRYHCNHQKHTSAETPDAQDEKEALDFVANVLGISDSSVLSKQVEEPPHSTTIFNSGKFALIKQLRKQNKPESIKTLEEIFKNQHEYSTAKNIINFDSGVERLSVFCNDNIATNNVVHTRKMFKQVCRQIKGLNNTTPPEFEYDTLCPLNLTEFSRNYQQLCNFVFKLVQPILAQSRYEIKILEPRYRYQCKKQLSKEKLLELSQQKPEFNEDEDTIENQTSTDFRYPFVTKKIRSHIYMGPRPEIIYHAVDTNNVEVTITKSTKPEEFGDTNSSYVKENNATLRTIKRTKFVMDIVHQEKVITDIFSITKLLHNQDIEEGYNVKIDRKSVDRIFMRLVKSGLIKMLQVTLQFSDSVKSSTVICDAAYDLQYSVIESLIEQLKMKAFSSSSLTKVQPSFEDDHFISNDITSSLGELSLLSNSDPPYVFKRNIGRDYGNAPKFMRMRILHEFMFYLIYDYNREATHTFVKGNSDLPPIYSQENNWKLFVPPLPKHKSWPEGWVLVCDLLLRLPLSLFVKICNVSFVIPELNELLEDPIKQHILIKYLPPDVRNALLYKRKYIFTIHECICRLCFIGLVQFGPQKLRDKDQVFVYLNRRASLWDTTVSAPGYHYTEEREYKHLRYNFKNADTVDNYWYEMWNICMHTKLGLRQTVTGTYITIENLDRKPLMVEAMTPKTPELALSNDVGQVPGDKRGAAGFDSALWSHVKRNWIWGEKTKKRLTSRIKRKSKILKNRNPGFTKQRSNVLRKVLPRKDSKKGARTDYDAVDRKLLVRLQQSRPEWVDSEDKVLQICKIVVMFIYRTAPRHFIAYTVIRDVLHKLSPISSNKTSGSVRRRSFNVFGAVEKQELFQQIAKTLNFIPYVKKYFHTIQNEKQAFGAFVFLTIYFFEHQNEMQHIFDLLLSNIPIPNIPMSNEVLEITEIELVDNVRKATLYSKLNKNHPQTENDVILDTIQSIIHSSLACNQSESGWLIQLFSVYRKYSQDLLRRALDHLRINHLTAGRRPTIRKVKNIEGAPIITKFFQFSHFYCYTQITKYPPELFIESHEIFLSIFKDTHGKLIPMENFRQGHTVGLAELAVYATAHINVDIPKEVLVLNPNIADHTELIHELAVRYKKMLTLVKSGAYFSESDQVGNEKAKYGCRWPMIHRFLRSWFLSDESEDDNDTEVVQPFVVTTLPKMVPILSQEEGKHVIGDLIPVRASTNNPDTTFEDYEKKLECFLTTNNVPETSEELIVPDTLPVSDDTNVLRNYLTSFQRKDTHTIETVTETVDVITEKHDERIQYLMNDELTIEQIMEEMLNDCPLQERKVPKPTNLARLLVLGLFPELDDDEERLERLYKHFLVICPETKFMMPFDLETNSKLDYLHSKHLDVCKKLIKKVERDAIASKVIPDLDQVTEKLQRMGFTDYDIHIMEKLVSFVHKKQFLGVSIKQLKERYPLTDDSTLAKTLKVLTETNLLMRTGITYFVYVHYEYRKPWLVDSCVLAEQDRLKLMDTKPETLHADLPSLSSLESYEEIKLRMRPWTLIDGSLNTEVFLKWMYTVLGHCLSDAAIPLSRVIELCAFLKPTDIYYLLECLKYLGCVRLIAYKKEKCTLFSTLVYAEEVEALVTEDFENIYVECDSLALNKLGMLLNEKEQCYNFSDLETSRYESF